MLRDDKFFYVPKCNEKLTTNKIITAELIEGKPLDECVSLEKATRHKIGKKLFILILRELYDFKMMQTDPNWSNFFYSESKNRLNLIDFGACSTLPMDFIARYFKIIEASAKKDVDGICKWSTESKFLNGAESQEMLDAHVSSVLILGEPFQSDKPYDFSKQDITQRMRSNLSTMMEQRIQKPPKETYVIHRKLSGIFLLLNKLGVELDCKSLFEEYALKHTAEFNSYLKLT